MALTVLAKFENEAVLQPNPYCEREKNALASSLSRPTTSDSRARKRWTKNPRLQSEMTFDSHDRSLAVHPDNAASLYQPTKENPFPSLSSHHHK